MLEAGHILGNYTILSALGSGGMGEVYLAEDARLGRQIAVKVLLPEVANDEERLARFVREARASSSLNHPNILTIYEIGEADGTHFIAAEYVKGHTLRHLMRHGELTIDQALAVAHQAANALGAAHAAGIIHRDIKPDNIMVRDDGLVKVLDFGLAKLVDSSPEVSEPDDTTRIKFDTEPGKVMGTTAYMSPEQARGHILDARSDIFSFGIVLYELFSGTRPFEGTSSADLISSILKDEPAPIRELSPDLPRHLERILTKALRKDPAQRYQQIKDLEIDLDDLRTELRQDTAQQRTARATLRAGNTHDEGDRKTLASSISTTRRFTILHAAIFLMAVGAVAAGLILYLPGRARTGTGEPIKTVEVASWASQPGEIYSVGRFSPDGKMVAFASTRNGVKQLFVKQTTAGEAVQVTAAEGDVFADDPVWSPDGDELAFRSNRDGRIGIWTTPILGGTPKLIAPLEEDGSLLRRWSKTGLIYFESNNELSAVDAGSGSHTRITDLKAESIEARWFSIAPDEKRIAYASTEGKRWTLWTKEIGGAKPPVKVHEADAEIRNIVWHPEGTVLFYSVSVKDAFQIFTVDLNGSPPVQLTSAERDCFALDVSADGSRVLYGSAREESDVWGVNMTDRKEFAVASGIEAELWPAVSPDGRAIAFQSVKNLGQGNSFLSGKIVIKKPDSREEPRQIVANGFLPTFSPDSKHIAFIQLDGVKYYLATIAADGGEPKRLATDGMPAPSMSILPYLRVNSTEYSWSPDSTRLAYVSRRSGPANLFVAGIDGSPEVQLTDNADAKMPLYSPIWSPDGSSIAFTSRNAVMSADRKETWSVSVIDVASRVSRPIVSRTERARLLGWSDDGTELIVASTPGTGTTGSYRDLSLTAFTLDGGRQRSIAQVKDAYLGNIFLSPDRRLVAYSAHREGKDDIWTIPAAGGSEKKITANNDSRLYFSTLTLSPDSSTIYFGKQSRYSLLSMITNFR